MNRAKKKYVNRHCFSIVVGAGAARRLGLVYYAVCGYRTGTTRLGTAQPCEETFTYNFWLY